MMEKEYYTVQQCRDQRISIKVENDEQRKIVAEKLSELLGHKVNFHLGVYLRVYNSSNNSHDTYGWTSKSYLIIGMEEFRSTKEITFDQLIIENEKPMQDLNLPLRIVGKPKLIEAIAEDLKEIGYRVEGYENPVQIQTGEEGGIVVKYVTDSLTTLGMFSSNVVKMCYTDSKLYQLPRDYVECLEFAKAQKENLKLSIKIQGFEIELREGYVHIEIDEDKYVYSKSGFLIMINRWFDQQFVGKHEVRSITIGCTTFTREDYNKLKEFLK